MFAHTPGLSRQYMAWEGSFGATVLKIREKALKYRKLNYTIEVSSRASLPPLRQADTDVPLGVCDR